MTNFEILRPLILEGLTNTELEVYDDVVSEQQRLLDAEFDRRFEVVRQKVAKFSERKGSDRVVRLAMHEFPLQVQQYIIKPLFSNMNPEDEIECELVAGFPKGEETEVTLIWKHPFLVYNAAEVSLSLSKRPGTYPLQVMIRSGEKYTNGLWTNADTRYVSTYRGGSEATRARATEVGLQIVNNPRFKKVAIFEELLGIYK